MHSIEEEFNVAYDNYADALFRHCVFRISNRERALELVQEAYMKSWNTACKGEKIKNWRALLYRYINNLIIDEYRKKKQDSLDALLEKEGVTEASFDDLYTDAFKEHIKNHDSAIEAKRLHHALTKLNHESRQVLVMRYMDYMKIKEIAEILQTSENVISVRINRALKKIKKIL